MTSGIRTHERRSCGRKATDSMRRDESVGKAEVR